MSAMDLVPTKGTRFIRPSDSHLVPAPPPKKESPLKKKQKRSFKSGVSQMLAVKSLDTIVAEDEGNPLNRTLTWVDLTNLGIGKTGEMIQVSM